MELVQVLIVAFGGSVAALAVTAFLGKALISQLLAREMEGLRSRLKVEGDTLVESLKARLQQDARLDDRQFALAQVMRRYQGPLLHAVYDLQSRLYNILVNRFFDVYLVGGSPTQKQYAAYNTSFLIAQFFGWIEIIRQEVQFIEFAEDDKTRRFSDIRDEIYGLWQTDRFGDPLMIWAGEQRGIGELMIEIRGDQLTCKGYATFLKSFGAAQEQLVDRLTQAVLASATKQGVLHDRLLAVQHKLIEMLEVLDPDGLRFRAVWRTKA
ncbi:hypothetical protein [Methylibium sp.]|uniref:hypothetical protein n=1 Tax=Methylibium sp. TaxID=2067992 RepID=UPI003D11CE00